MSTTEIVSIIHACTTNDTNGNPRRIFVGLNCNGSIVKIEDEGYAGRPAWVRQCAADFGLYTFPLDVTPKQYRNLRKVKP